MCIRLCWHWVASVVAHSAHEPTGCALSVKTAVGAPGSGDTASSETAKPGRRTANAERGPLEAGRQQQQLVKLADVLWYCCTVMQSTSY